MKTLVRPVVFCHQILMEWILHFQALVLLETNLYLDFNKPLASCGLEAEQVTVLCGKSNGNIGQGAKEKQRERAWLGATSQNLICATDTHSNEFMAFLKRSSLVPTVKAKESCHADGCEGRYRTKWPGKSYSFIPKCIILGLIFRQDVYLFVSAEKGNRPHKSSNLSFLI